MSITDMHKKPWDDESSGHNHNIVEHSELVVKCTRCGKMATAERKLEQTPCNP